jgi:predicted adenine nucleotide alpha hydrolase (AANH) superfamily ATPase
VTLCFEFRQLHPHPARDLNIYPNTIISLNISPETKIGKVLSEENGEVNIRLATGKTINLTKDKFDKLVEKELLSISKYNILYTQKFKGVIPNLIDRLYNERVQTKDEIQKNKQALHKEKDPEKIKIFKGTTKTKPDKFWSKPKSVNVLSCPKRRINVLSIFS